MGVWMGSGEAGWQTGGCMLHQAGNTRIIRFLGWGMQTSPFTTVDGGRNPGSTHQLEVGSLNPINYTWF